MNSEQLIQGIQQKLGLTFLKNKTEGNLCFAGNNEELQNEFKTVFTKEDLENFIQSFGENEIQIPNEISDFWKRVELVKH